MFRNTEIVCDKTSLTFDEAKELWNQYYEDAAKWIKNEGVVEMVLWINMETPSSYDEFKHFISTDAESDGHNIWVVKKEYFVKYNP